MAEKKKYYAKIPKVKKKSEDEPGINAKERRFRERFSPGHTKEDIEHPESEPIPKSIRNMYEKGPYPQTKKVHDEVKADTYRYYADDFPSNEHRIDFFKKELKERKKRALEKLKQKAK